jgi:hypothetical protein
MSETDADSSHPEPRNIQILQLYASLVAARASSTQVRPTNCKQTRALLNVSGSFESIIRPSKRDAYIGPGRLLTHFVNVPVNIAAEFTRTLLLTIESGQRWSRERPKRGSRAHPTPRCSCCNCRLFLMRVQDSTNRKALTDSSNGDVYGATGQMIAFDKPSRTSL